MKHLAILALLLLAPFAWGQDAKAKPASSLRKVSVRKDGKHSFHTFFQDRQQMRKGHPLHRFEMNKVVQFIKDKKLPAPPATVDWCKSLSFPMMGNDRYGDCMAAAAAHAQGTFTGNVGKEWVPTNQAVVDWYFKLTGGVDRGLDEGTLIAGWKNGVTDDQGETIILAMDIDPTNDRLMQGAIWYFGGVIFMLDVPDPWIDHFTGSGNDVWDAPAVANQNNGHGVFLNGASSKGYTLLTWGSKVTITSAGIKACDPSAFVVFPAQWFDPKTGYAPNGVHVVDAAALWQQGGGAPVPAAFINQFPAPSSGPIPVPPPPTPGAANTIVITIDGVSTTYELLPAGTTDLLQKLKPIFDALPTKKTSSVQPMPSPLPANAGVSARVEWWERNYPQYTSKP